VVYGHDGILEIDGGRVAWLSKKSARRKVVCQWIEVLIGYFWNI